MATPKRRRPLSPHLQIYRPQITSVLSILHRLTGIFLSFAVLGLVVWLWALAVSPACFEGISTFLSAWYGKSLLLGVLFSFFYHLLNGVRHLVWDAGYGFELHQVTYSGWTVVGLSGAATLFCAVRYLWG